GIVEGALRRLKALCVAIIRDQALLIEVVDAAYTARMSDNRFCGWRKLSGLIWPIVERIEKHDAAEARVHHADSLSSGKEEDVRRRADENRVELRVRRGQRGSGTGGKYTHNSRGGHAVGEWRKKDQHAAHPHPQIGIEVAHVEPSGRIEI